VSQIDPAPPDPQATTSLAAPPEQYQQSIKAIGKLVERITPWLMEFGSWLFGSLIALTLLVLASLLTVGPVDLAVLIATAALALALPLAVAGLFLLRLDQDLKRIGIEEELAQAFQDTGFPDGGQSPSPQTADSLRRRRAGVILVYSLAMLLVSVVLALIGVSAALWHMAWWIGIAFLAMVVISQGIVIAAFANARPPDSPEEKERKRRYQDELGRRARELSKKGAKRA
jgi:MFS family permease